MNGMMLTMINVLKSDNRKKKINKPTILNERKQSRAKCFNWMNQQQKQQQWNQRNFFFLTFHNRLQHCGAGITNTYSFLQNK